MATSLQRTVLVGLGVIALVWSGVRGSEALTAYAKDRREVADPVTRLPALRKSLAGFGLVDGPVADKPRPLGDATFVLAKVKELLSKDKQLAVIANGLVDASALKDAKGAPQLRALIDELLAAKSYLPYEALDDHSLFTTIVRSAERISIRVACIDATDDIKNGQIDKGLAKLTKTAVLVSYLADHTDPSGVIAWYAGTRMVTTGLLVAAGRPDIRPEQLENASKCLDVLMKSPQMDRFCARMMNELVLACRNVDKMTDDDLANLNMNNRNTHPPKTDKRSREAMESGLLAYWDANMPVAVNKSATALDRGLQIDTSLLPLQQEDHVDKYMLRTITPTVFQIGQTITRGTQLTVGCRTLLTAAKARLATGNYPHKLPTEALNMVVDGCSYPIEYVYDSVHPAAVLAKEKMTDYDITRHVSVEPANGVYINL
ncbi:MAG: hypothetical protein JSS65_02945 [Armatimonadetes bacterium]|nr:hypothetical protein [Armatimonadota bacterium]